MPLAPTSLLWSYKAGQVIQNMTYTRATTATRRTRTGTLESVASGILRNHWTDVDGDGVHERYGTLIEGARTNLVTDPENFGNWTTIGSPGVTGSQSDPEGGTSAYLIEDDDGASSERIVQVVSFTGDADKAISIFARRYDRDTFDYVLEDTTDGTGTHRIRVDFGSDPPDLTSITGSGTLFTPERYANGWWRILAGVDGVTAGHTNRLVISPATGTASGTGGVYVFGAQAEDALFPSSYMPPGATTRNADSLTSPLNFGVQDMTVYARVFRPVWLDGVTHWTEHLQIGATANPYLAFRLQNTGSSVIWRSVIDPSANERTSAANVQSGDVIDAVSQFRDLLAAGQVRVDGGGGFSNWSATYSNPISAFGTQTIRLGSPFDIRNVHGSIEIIKVVAGLVSLSDMANLPTPHGR